MDVRCRKVRLSPSVRVACAESRPSHSVSESSRSASENREAWVLYSVAERHRATRMTPISMLAFMAIKRPTLICLGLTH